MNKLTLWDKFLQLFGTKITWEWCLVGCVIGDHSWIVSQEKCRNGTPVRAGWFLTIVKCDTEQEARELLPEFEKIAKEANERRREAVNKRWDNIFE